jgi:hypothetical protein
VAQIDGSLAAYTTWDAVADRADVWKIAARVLRDAGLTTEASPEDVLYLAQFLAGNDF